MYAISLVVVVVVLVVVEVEVSSLSSWLVETRKLATMDGTFSLSFSLFAWSRNDDDDDTTASQCCINGRRPYSLAKMTSTFLGSALVVMVVVGSFSLVALLLLLLLSFSLFSLTTFRCNNFVRCEA